MLGFFLSHHIHEENQFSKNLRNWVDPYEKGSENELFPNSFGFKNLYFLIFYIINFLYFAQKCMCGTWNSVKIVHISTSGHGIAWRCPTVTREGVGSNPSWFAFLFLNWTFYNFYKKSELCGQPYKIYKESSGWFGKATGVPSELVRGSMPEATGIPARTISYG